MSVQIISKNAGQYRVVKSMGSSDDPDEIARLVLQAKEQIEHREGQGRLFAVETRETHAVDAFVHSLSNAQVRTIGPELIFGALFDRMGFGVVPEELFRHITIARLAFPSSKLKTADYLRRFSGKKVEVGQIYRFLDMLNRRYKALVEEACFQHTKKVLQTISVVFYDMTTLYFEAEDEDDLRKIGFSKDGKFQQPQIMVGLLVGEGGFPIGYDLFEGNTFEGHTLMPTLKKIEKKYGFGKPIVVADAGLLSRENLKKLSDEGYRFIVGGRVKNESEALKKTILSWAKDHGVDGSMASFLRPDGTKLIVSFTLKRARKDFHNRERGLKKLRMKVSSGRLTKHHITNRGYNKFLKLEGEVWVSVDEERAGEEARWDGLKGYITNTDSSPGDVIRQYGNLWHIEEAFRISKTDLRVRPVFHRVRRRIEAHLCITFVAYAIWKELDRLLKCRGLTMSAKRAGALTQNMYEIIYQPHDSSSPRSVLLRMDDEQQRLYDAVSKT